LCEFEVALARDPVQTRLRLLRLSEWHADAMTLTDGAIAALAQAVKRLPHLCMLGLSFGKT
jgi:hypothetical protein